MKAILSISALLILSYSCNNTAPKIDSGTSIDTSKQSDSSALIMNDTVPVTGVTNATTPPPPPRIIEMQAVKSDYGELDPPPITEVDIKPNFDSDDNLIPIDATGPIPEVDSKIYLNVDQKPEMPFLREFLFNNLIYPESALNAGIQGVSTIGFVVNENGSLENIKVINSSGNKDLDTEAIRVMKKTTGRWKPGRINGKAVKTQMSLPITFEVDQ